MLLLASVVVSVALTRRVASVEAVVAELAEKSGQPLAIRREMRDETVYVGLGQHSADEAMRLIARATGAEWTSEAGRIYLGRSAPLRRKQERDEREDLAHDLATGLVPLLETADPKPWATGTDPAATIRRVADAPVNVNDPEAWSRHLAAMDFATPAGRLLARVLRATPPTDFAAIPLGETARFASKPRARQGALLGADLRGYAEEHAMLVDEWDRMDKEERNALAQAMSYSDAPRPLRDGDVPYAVLYVARYSEGMFQFALRLYDPKGMRIDESNVMVEARPKLMHDDAPWRKEPVRLGPAATSFWKGLRGKPVDPAQAALARDPVAHEPLGLILGDALDGIAATRGGETILAIPDDVGPGVVHNAHETLGEIDEALESGVVFETVDGVRVGHARRPASAAATKTDRTVLRGLMAQMRGGRYPGLDAEADYALRQNPNVGAIWLEKDALMGAGFFQQVVDGRVAYSVYEGARDLVRVYGSLSPEARSAFRRGTPLPFAALSPEARQDLERYLFRRSASADTEGRLTEPSAFFDGVPVGGEIVATGSEANPLVALAPTGEGTEFHDVLGLAFMEYAKEKGQLKPDDPDVTAQRYVPVWSNALKLEIRLSPTIRQPASLADLVYDPATAPVGLVGLPAEHQKERRRVLDLLRKRGG